MSVDIQVLPSGAIAMALAKHRVPLGFVPESTSSIAGAFASMMAKLDKLMEETCAVPVLDESIEDVWIIRGKECVFDDTVEEHEEHKYLYVPRLYGTLIMVSGGEVECVGIPSTGYCRLAAKGKHFVESSNSSGNGGIDIKLGSTTMLMPNHCMNSSWIFPTAACNHKRMQVWGSGSVIMETAVLRDVWDILGLTEDPGLSVHRLTIRALMLHGGSTSSPGTMNPVLWLDSGAGHHVVCDARFLHNPRNPPAGATVIVADGTKLPVTMVGDIQTPHIRIQEVSYVPGLKDNLISVRQLARSGIVTTFYDNYAELWREGKKVGCAFADANNTTSLYRLNFLRF
ncbi:hypothetical protein ACP70R_008105 [Stipagrostis hirtigluma subsp. patula]